MVNKRYTFPTLSGVQEARDPAAEEPRGCAGVQEEEEGVHQVSGEPRGRAREPEQGADRGTQVAQGTVHRCVTVGANHNQGRLCFVEIICPKWTN